MAGDYREPDPPSLGHLPSAQEPTESDELIRRAQAEYAIGRLLGDLSPAPPAQMLRRALDVLTDGLAARLATHWEHVDGVLRPAYTSRSREADATEWFPAISPPELSAGEGLPGRALAARRPVTSADVHEDVPFANQSAIEHLGIRSGFAVPIVGAETVYGVFDFYDARPAFRDDLLIESMDLIGSMLGRRLDRAAERSQLRAHYARIESLFKFAPVGLAFLDRDGRWLQVNEALARMNGRPVEEHIGREVRDLLPDLWPIFEPTFRRVIDHAQPETMLLTGTTPADDLEHHWSETLFPMVDGDTVIGVGVVVTDDTDRVHADREVRVRAGLLDAVDEAVIATDVRGRITHWNRFAEELYGWAAAEVRGRLVQEVTTTPGSRDQVELMMAAIARGETWAGDVEARHRDGQPLLVHLVVSPVTDEGSPTGMVGVSTDVSARVAVEQALRQANEIQSEFLGLVSHEMLTPLTSVVGFAEMLERRGESLEAATRVEITNTMAAEARRLRDIVTNMLTLARLDAEPPVLDAVSVHALVEATTDSESARHPGRLACELSGPPVHVNGNAEWIAQIVRNLLGNALKYSPAGSPVDVRVDATDGDVIVRVLDRGPGVADEMLARLFTPFERGSQSRGPAPGLGLGLTVCQRLVEIQGGRIWLAPRDGGGLEVGFSLPVVSVTSQSDSTDALTEDAGHLESDGTSR